MSNYLTGLAQLNPQVKRHNGGTTTLTLDQNGTTNATMLYVNGVAQSPGTDFSVSGATLTTTSTLPAGVNICTTIQYFSTGIVNTVADDAIGLGQMASGTDGNLITYDASGNPAHVATGNDGQVLTSAGAGAAPVFEDVGTWNLIGTVVASSSATLAITGINSTYDTYFIAWSDIVPATDNVKAFLRFGDSGGYDSGASDYGWMASEMTAGSTSGSEAYAEDDADSEITIGGVSNSIGNASGEGFTASAWLQRPSDGTVRPTIHGFWNMVNPSSQQIFGDWGGGRHAVITMDRLQLHMSSGNIATGRMTVWGIAHA